MPRCSNNFFLRRAFSFRFSYKAHSHTHTRLSGALVLVSRRAQVGGATNTNSQSILGAPFLLTQEGGTGGAMIQNNITDWSCSYVFHCVSLGLHVFLCGKDVKVDILHPLGHCSALMVASSLMKIFPTSRHRRKTSQDVSGWVQIHNGFFCQVNLSTPRYKAPKVARLLVSYASKFSIVTKLTIDYRN